MYATAHTQLWCADEKAAAINDRIAWLERVINDRNMEVSLAGAPDPDDEVGSTSAGTPLAHPAHAGAASHYSMLLCSTGQARTT